MKFKAIALALVAVTLVGQDAFAQKRGGSSSRPSSRSSSRPSTTTSRPPTSLSRPSSPSASKPLFGGGSSQKSSTPPASKPLFGGGSSQKPSTNKGTSVTGDRAKPKFSAPNSTPSNGGDQAKSKFGSNGSLAVAGSAPPKNTGVNPLADANKREVSKRVFAEQKKATAPPKAETVVAGKSVKVDTTAPGLSDLRSKPVDVIKPERRVDRTRTFIIERNHYHHDYNWYASRPAINIGSPYSNAFMWIMLTEWDANRRAEWLYHHRYEPGVDAAYQRGLQDAQVQARLAALEQEKVLRNTTYVDQDFREDPSLAYDQNYVEAAYNPTVTEVPVQAMLTPAVITPSFPRKGFLVIVIGVVGFAVWYVAIRRPGV